MLITNNKVTLLLFFDGFYRVSMLLILLYSSQTLSVETSSHLRSAPHTNTPPLHILAFHQQGTLTSGATTARLTWRVVGATELELVRLQSPSPPQPLTTNQGHISVAVEGVTVFELRAQGADGRQISQQLTLAAPAAPHQPKGSLSHYRQPFANKGLDIIAYVTLPDKHGVYVATHDRKLYRFTDQGVARWSLTLAGVLPSPPVVSGDALYFTVSLLNGQSQLCRATITTGRDFVCQHIEATVLTSPIVLPPRGWFQQAAAQFNPFSSQTTTLSNVIYLLDTQGGLHQFAFDNLQPQQHYRLTLRQHRNIQAETQTPLTVTPRIDLTHQRLIIRRGQHLAAYPLPDVTPSASRTLTARIAAVFGASPESNTAAHVKKDTPPLSLAPLWTQALEDAP